MAKLIHLYHTFGWHPLWEIHDTELMLILILWDLAICLKFLIFKTHAQIVNVGKMKLCNVHDAVFIRGWWLSLTVLSLLCNSGVITMSTVISTKNPPWFKHQVKPWFTQLTSSQTKNLQWPRGLCNIYLYKDKLRNIPLRTVCYEVEFYLTIWPERTYVQLVVLHYWHLLSLIHTSVSIFWRKRKEWVLYPFSTSTQHPHRHNVTI